MTRFVQLADQQGQGIMVNLFQIAYVVQLDPNWEIIMVTGAKLIIDAEQGSRLMIAIGKL